MKENNQNEIAKALNTPILKLIAQIASTNNTRSFVIGGYVRDYFLERPSTDIDIVVEGSGIELAEKAADALGKVVHVYKNFGTALIQNNGLDIEFVGARKESYRANSRKPIVEDGTLEDDQKRRDFTINAMAFNLDEKNFGELVDPFNGISDLHQKLIRTPLDPDTTFSDDPLRMIRAIRFATQLNFTIVPESLEAIVRNCERIKIVSMERVSEELHKIMLSQVPSIGLNLLDKTGLLKIIFPQLSDLKGVETSEGKQHKDNFYHTLKVVDNISEVSNNLWLRWAALLHDIAKPATKRYDPELGWTFHGHEFVGSKMIPTIFKQLKLPLNEKMKYVQKLVLLHLRPIAISQEVTDSAVRRLLFDAGEELDDLMTLCDADITSKNERTVRRHLQNFQLVREKLKEIEEKDAVRNFQPPVSGELIMETYNVGPCREVGIIKSSIKEAILDGIINNSFDEAFAYMREKASELGLTEKK